jgi:bacterial/archaeal transporter family-2 protein
MIFIPVLLSFLAGLLIAVQGVVNSVGSKMMGTPWMIAWLSLVQSLPVLIYAIVHKSNFSLMDSLQGWKWFLFSGFLGIAILSSLTFSISKSDALLVFVLVILGQIIGSAVADMIGLFGIKVQPLSMLKITTILIIIAGTGLLYFADYQTSHNYAHQLKKT